MKRIIAILLTVVFIMSFYTSIEAMLIILNPKSNLQSANNIFTGEVKTLDKNIKGIKAVVEVDEIYKGTLMTGNDITIFIENLIDIDGHLTDFPVVGSEIFALVEKRNDYYYPINHNCISTIDKEGNVEVFQGINAGSLKVNQIYTEYLKSERQKRGISNSHSNNRAFIIVGTIVAGTSMLMLLYYFIYLRFGKKLKNNLN